MIGSPAEARVLVASDAVAAATQVQLALEEHFPQVALSTVQDLAAQDFEAHQPHVLVLAFDSLERAKNYYLGLYRFGQSLQQCPHRTILLCAKDELRNAFELCKKRYFDDYVLYWPFAHDGLRLPMSVWAASRELMAISAQAPLQADLSAHVQHLGDLERTLGRDLSGGEEKIAAAQSSFAQLERQLAGATDEFSRRLVTGGAIAGVSVKDGSALTREIERLKQQHLAQTRAVGAGSIEPLKSWVQSFKADIEPALKGTQALSQSLRDSRPLLMIVDDDEVTRELLVRTLKDGAYDVLPVGDGIDAMRELRHVRPDVIFMDIRLPGLDGVSLTRRLKASPHLADIPVIMMTGEPRREAVISSIEAGAADFVVKPFTREALLAKLHKLLPA